jgi:uncharacterized membrane protein
MRLLLDLLQMWSSKGERQNATLNVSQIILTDIYVVLTLMNEISVSSLYVVHPSLLYQSSPIKL